MSTSPDALVQTLSRWLAGHIADGELRAALDDAPGLSADQEDAVGDLRAALDRPSGRGELQRAAREALEALALGQ